MRKFASFFLLACFLAAPTFAQGPPVTASTTPTVDYRPVIQQAYRDILDRDADPSGLTFYNGAMNGSLGLPMTEAQLRESLLRSAEYVGKHSLPTPPTPPPSPPPGTTGLHVAGPLFLNANNEEVKLLGVISCCADQDSDAPGTIEYGWPLVTDAFIDVVADHHMNFAHVRLGPMVSKAVDPDGELRNDVQGYGLAPSGTQYDLTKWDGAYWNGLRARAAHAQSRGINFQVDIADAWVAEHGLTPWRASHNIQGYDDGGLAALKKAPGPIHEAWIRKVVSELCGYNVLWQDGNESFKGATPAWTFGMRDIVADQERRSGCPHRPFGTNSQNEEIERGVDYGVWHKKTVPEATTYPRLTNEYDEMTPSDILDQVRTARSRVGVAFMYWRGDHGGKVFHDTLDALQRIVDGTDIPPEIPDSCPDLARWGSKIFNVMDGAFQAYPAPPGGWVNGVTLPAGAVLEVTDSTPRFGPGKGVPCNAEHPNCGGRKCEDPRGGVWTLEEGTAPLHIQANGFQARVGPMSPGHYVLRVGPRPDVKDAYGKPVTVRGDVSTITDWWVQ